MTTQDKNPTPIPTARPADPMTAADGARLYSLIEGWVKELDQNIRGLSARIATLQGNQLDILDLISRIDTGLSSSRTGRLDLELREAELEKEAAERNLRTIEEKYNIKKEVKEKSSLDTEQKIQTVASSTYEQIEAKKKAEYNAWLLDLKRGIIKTVLGAVAVASTFGFFSFLWWIFRQYINNGGP